MSAMASEYRQDVIKSSIVGYWNRKLDSSNIGMDHCLRQIDTRLNLKLEEKQPVHAAYYSHVARLRKEPSISKQLQVKAESEFRNFKRVAKSLSVTKFWESKGEGSYRQTLDSHTRKEKEYLSSRHLAEFRAEDSNNNEEEFEEYEGSFLPSVNDSSPNCAFEPDNDAEVVERNEPESVGRTRRWILTSGTDVGQVLAAYCSEIPESQKCVDPVYWGILDLTGAHPETKELFSTADWNEMLKSFEDDVKMVQEEPSDAVYLLFDKIDEIVKSREDVVAAIDEITLQEIEATYGTTLSPQEKSCIVAVKRAVLTYAENLADVEDLVSESAFDSLFTNMLTKRFLDRTELRMDTGEICSWASAQRRNEGRSVTLRARVGQKCDFRGTLKHSINKLEALIGLRSGGLPEAHKKKIFVDSLDLSITMRDVLHSFFSSNTNALDNDLHEMFVLGFQSWGWTHQIVGMDCKATNVCRYGRLCTTILPNTTRTLACLEAFYVNMKNAKATLNHICNKANETALTHTRVHRRLKRKKETQEEIENCRTSYKRKERNYS